MRRAAGFTLIELMIVVAILAIISAVAVPNLVSARAATNETAAVSTLRTLFNAQAQFFAGGVLDADNDGLSEYACFGELAGVLPLNARGNGVPRRLEPPYLPDAFGIITAAGNVVKSGYSFRIYLPDANGLGVSETPGNPPPGVDSDFCERVWTAYAWPLEPGITGRHAFVVNERGELLETTMTAAQYDRFNPPGWAAAFEAAGQGDMTDQLAVAAPANDGNDWVAVQ